MGQVLFRRGNIFEGSADLTVLPCSAKGTVSSATRTWLTCFNLKSPQEMKIKLDLGKVSMPILFPGSKAITKNVVFASSVLNDYSSAEALENIGKCLGHLTRKYPSIRIIETPLLGTGAGGLNAIIAAESLFNGFRSTALSDAVLYVFVFDKDRYDSISKIGQKNDGQNGYEDRTAPPRIFISHAASDKLLVHALIELLETAFCLSFGDIRCTSIPGYKLPTGTHSSVQLREEIRESELVIGIVTPKSVKSSYVLFELGASWGLRKPTFPLLAHTTKFDLIPGPLKENNAMALTRNADVQQLLKDIVSSIKIKKRAKLTVRIEDKITNLVSIASKM